MFRWLFKRADSFRDLPMAILRAAIFGAFIGPPWGLLFAYLDEAYDPFLKAPGHWVIWASSVGAIYSVIFFLLSGAPFIYLRRHLRKCSASAASSLAIVVCLIGGGSAAAITPKIILFLFGVKLIPDEAWFRSLVVNTLIAVVIGLIFGNYRRFEMLQEIREQELAATAAKAEVHALQAQMSPHFFFNALNSISALVPSSPELAQEMLGRLAGIYRYTFSCARAETVPLVREMEFVREYLLLEKVRYRDRLQFELPALSAVPDVSVPGLSVQPLVENAIRYGISKRMAGGSIRIEVQPNGCNCAIHVSNQFDPQDGPPDLGEGTVFRADHALANVRERLWLLFGEHATIQFSLPGADWVRATVTVPSNGAAG